MFLVLFLVLPVITWAALPIIINKAAPWALQKFCPDFVKIGQVWVGHLLEIKISDVALSGQWLSQFGLPFDAELVHVGQLHVQVLLQSRPQLKVHVSGLSLQLNADRVETLGPTPEELEESVRSTLMGLLDWEENEWFYGENPQPGFNLVPFLPYVAKFAHFLTVKVTDLHVRLLQSSSSICVDAVLPAVTINPETQTWRESLKPAQAQSVPETRGDLMVHIDSLSVHLDAAADCSVFPSPTDEPEKLVEDLQKVFAKDAAPIGEFIH